MQTTVDTIQMALAFSSLYELGFIVAVIGGIGYFLWSKGRETTSPKR